MNGVYILRLIRPVEIPRRPASGTTEGCCCKAEVLPNGLPCLLEGGMQETSGDQRLMFRCGWRIIRPNLRTMSTSNLFVFLLFYEH